MKLNTVGIPTAISLSIVGRNPYSVTIFATKGIVTFVHTFLNFWATLKCGVSLNETINTVEMIVFWGNAPCGLVDIALMMEVQNSSQTSVSCCQTPRRNVPEDGHLHTRRCENMKSHSLLVNTVLRRTRGLT
jgi:hypothetical protein